MIRSVKSCLTFTYPRKHEPTVAEMLPRIVFSWWLSSVVVAILLCHQFTWARNQIFKTTSNNYILRTYDGKAEAISSADALAALEYMGTITNISDAELSLLIPGSAVPNVAFNPSMTADDSIEIMLTHLRTLQPVRHYLISMFTFPDFQTPTIVEVNDKVLVIFRSYERRTRILFGWMSNDISFEFTDAPVSHYNISYPETRFGYSEVQNDPKALLLRSATMRHKYPNQLTSHHTNGHEVFISYSSGSDLRSCKNHFVRMFIPSQAAMLNAQQNPSLPPPTVVFSKPNELYYTEGGAFQKNWVAFEYKAKVLLIERINPMHIMELVADGNGTEEAEEVQAEVKTLHKMDKVDLPWNSRYGVDLRGGTHAILVHTRPRSHPHGRNSRHLYTASSAHSSADVKNDTNSKLAAAGHRRRLIADRSSYVNKDYIYNASFVDANAYAETEDTVYLSFFHTRVVPTWPYYAKLTSYFMGAMTHCNRPPFQIHSISSEPIVLDENQYRTAWFNNKINYVIYPTGLMLSKSNPNNVIVSYSTQDRDGQLATLDLHRLLASLTFVANCSTER